MNLRYRRLPTGQWLVFGLLLTLSVGMMGASGTRTARILSDDVNYMLNPVEVWMNGVGDTLSSYASTLANLDSVSSENQRLKAEVQQLEEQLGRMPAISRLNDDWTRISQAQQASPYRLLIASVVVRDISDVREKTIIVNRGRVDGLTVGEVVIDDGGAVVGRIQTINTNNSTIRLVNDFSSVVIGEEAETGAIGTLTGQVGGLLNMQYVSANKELIKGHTVVTAGMGVATDAGQVTSVYPKGLLIGTIVGVTTDPNQSYQSAVVQPAADLEGINYVMIILDYKGGFPSLAPSATGSPAGSPSESPPSSSGPSAGPTPRPTPTPGPTPVPTPSPTPPPGIVTPPPH